MRNTTTTVLVALLGFGLVESTTMIQNTLSSVSWEELMEMERIETERLIKYHENELERFLTDIGFKESGNRYDITNRLGYMGKYQFGKKTLRGLGFDVTKKEFLNNPELQEEAMFQLLLHNKEKLQDYIDIYDGKTINGIYITESGILAAAHLGGQGSVKRYFENGKVFKDANGTKITSYLAQFSGYDINLE